MSRTPPLHGLADAVRRVRRRLLAARLLEHANRHLAWSLAIVLLAAALAPLKVVLLAAAVLVAAVLPASAVTAWFARPSEYDAACRLDEAAGLRDRLSTAWHYRAAEAPSEMILRQRRDALERVAGADPRQLFPLRMPAAAGRTLVLALAAAGLLVYRGGHKPPLAAVAESVTPAALKKAMQVLRHPEPEPAAPLERQAARADSSEAFEGDTSQDQRLRKMLDEARGAAAGDGGMAQSDPSDSADGEAAAGDDAAKRDGSQAAGNPQGAGAGQSRKADEQEQAAAASRDKVGVDVGGEGQGSRPASPSLAQRIGQALKDLLNKALGEKGNSPDSRSASDRPADPQDPNGSDSVQKLPAPTSQQGARNMQEPGEGDPQSTASGTTMGSNETGQGDAPSATRSAPASTEPAHDPALETHPKQDVVTLPLSTFKGQANLLTSVQRGVAQVPFRDASPRSTTSTKGAEQGDMPLRYRSYVQQYFNHPDADEDRR